MNSPKTTLKLRHVSFYVQSMQQSLYFYRDVLGMEVYYAPNEQNIYLTNGDDAIALHSASQLRLLGTSKAIGLDHIGFFLPNSEALMAWYLYLRNFDLEISDVQKHGDGCEGFYVKDPDANSVEFTTVPKDLVFSDGHGILAE